MKSHSRNLSVFSLCKAPTINQNKLYMAFLHHPCSASYNKGLTCHRYGHWSGGSAPQPGTLHSLTHEVVCRSGVYKNQPALSHVWKVWNLNTSIFITRSIYFLIFILVGAYCLISIHTKCSWCVILLFTCYSLIHALTSFNATFTIKDKKARKYTMSLKIITETPRTKPSIA